MPVVGEGGSFTGAMAGLLRQCSLERQPAGDILAALGSYIGPRRKQRVELHLASIDDLRTGIDARKLAGKRGDVGLRCRIVCQIGFRQHDPVGEGELFQRFKVAVDRNRAVDDIIQRHETGQTKDAIDGAVAECRVVVRIADQRVDQRRRIAKPAHFDDDA